MKLYEILKAITADELNTVLDAEISAHDAGTEDSTHIVAWLGKEYPELIDFAKDCVGRYFENPSAEDPELISLIVMNTAITLGAMCRAVEARDLPEV